MTAGPKPDPLLWSACKERARRWVGTDLRGYPTLGADEETEETLAAAPTEEQLEKGQPREQDDKH